MNRLCVALFCLLILPAATSAQEHSNSSASPADSAPARTAAAAKPPADYSQEPFLIEQYSTTTRFEDDGTGERDLAVRIRVQNDAGAQQLGQIAFAYNAANEKVEIHYVRLRKADGALVNVAADSASDVPSAIAASAPAYATHKEERLAVPGLVAGDTLEYEAATLTTTPAAPGEFWFQHDFLASVVVLDESLEINVPESRKLTLESAATPYDTSHSNGRTIYRWKHTNLSVLSEDAAKKAVEQLKTKPHDVQLTTFATWAGVARWYGKPQRERAAPTPEIRAKTQELIKGRATDIEKIQALYEYVSKNIRYINFALGADGYDLHSAAEVFSNQYGDSRDKHTLLVAMLQAAGIQADSALISSSRKLDPSAPSPAQFDHVITAIPRGSEFLWLDSSPEVAPFRLLASPLRDKSVLLVLPDGTGRIEKTPADPPFLSTQDVNIDGQVSALGKLTAHAHYSMRGDTELVLRLAFFRTPQAQWKDLGQTILSLDGLHGEVASVKAGDPTDTRNPFQLDIDFTQEDFVDWSSKRAKAPLPLLAIGVPDPPDDAAKPIDIGSPLDVKVTLKLALPPSFSALTPIAVSVIRDYAEFRSAYRSENGAIHAERSLNFKIRELAASRLDDYQAFARAVAADQLQPLTILNPAPTVPESATPDELAEAGLAALNGGDAAGALPLFERTVQLDPNNKEAWVELGLTSLRLGKYDEAAAAFRKHLEINPSDEHANEYLGVALEHQEKYAEAIVAFRKQAEVNPLDATAYAALGGIFLAQHDYAQAAPELDKATILSPQSAELQVGLGRAYLNINEKEKALAAFEKAVALSASPLIKNDIAYDLADAKVELDKAQEYAASAISSLASDLRSPDLRHLSAAQLNEVASVSAVWDTQGWIYFQKGDLDSAQRYVRAAWLVDPQGEVGDHLAQIYDRLGQKDRAIHAYALALAAPNAIPETRARLTLLLGANSQIDEMVANAKPELAAVRAVSAGKLLNEDAQADFFVLLSPGEKEPHVDAVRFVSGSEKMRPLADRLRALDYGAMFPDASPMKLIRRGTLTCSAKTGDCTFTLAIPEDVTSAN